VNKIFSGTTLKCFFHFAEHYLPKKGARNSLEAKAPMAEFIGVIPGAVTRWASGGSEPAGDISLRLAFFLSAFGYDVSELKKTQKLEANYKLAELVGFGVVSLKEVQESLVFSNLNSVHRTYQGLQFPSRERREIIDSLYDSRLDALNLAKGKLQNQVKKTLDLLQIEQVVNSPAIVHGVPVRNSVKESKVTESQSSVSGGIDDTYISLLSKMVIAVTPLLEAVVANTSKDQRSKLRQTLGEDWMFRLSKASSRLCSEKALELMRQQ
jgi:transcriptional regulator with XRE-family HTH domain